jgi:hypothetical protein
MRLAVVVSVLAAILVAAPARAADAPAPKKRVVVMHYRTLEKMLRRFSLQAGSARTRG